jgi:nitrogen-specific signal transduction histidine kinase
MAFLKDFKIKSIRKSSFIIIGILIGVYLTSLFILSYTPEFYLQWYLIFHTMAEMLSIIISGTIFLIGWNARKNIEESFFLIIGTSFLSIGIIDLFHTLAFKGINIFTNYGANLSTQLWIAARYLQAFSILAGILLISKSLNPSLTLLIYMSITIILLVLIFLGLFPTCYNDVLEQLTPFKIYSEYIIIGIFMVAFLLFIRSRYYFSTSILKYLLLAIICIIFSEFFFTEYVSVYDLASLIGHILKIGAFYFFYIIFIQIGINDPYSILFGKFNKAEMELKNRLSDLDCLYSISILAERKNFNQNDFFNSLLDIIPYGFEHPQTLSLKITYADSIYKTQFYNESNFYISSKRILENKKLEFVLFCSNDYIFNLEEIALLNEVAVRVQHHLERKFFEQNLKNLISTLSHELRTPITVIAMSVDFLRSQGAGLTDEIKERLMDGILRNVGLLNELAEDVLILSQSDEKKLKLEWKEFNLYELLSDILYLIKPKADEKNVVIRLDLEIKLKIVGDKKRLGNLFRILIDNAIKYSRENSEILINRRNELLAHFNLPNAKGNLFSIADHGIGISKEDMLHLFEPFFRAKNALDTPGAGLGLKIAKEIIELHNGRIFVESDVGIGTTFFIYLPLQRNF